MQVTNNLSQAVNVYVTASGSSELFLRQVPANTVEKVPVPGMASGATVTFKAVTVDGSRTYQSRNVGAVRACSSGAFPDARARRARPLGRCSPSGSPDSFDGPEHILRPVAVFCPDVVTAARPLGRGTSVRLGAA